MELDFRDSLVFTGGGTGGHFYPAVALAEAINNRRPDRRIIFVGAKRGIEGRILPTSSWPHLLLDVEGFAGRSLIKAMSSIWRMFRARGHLKRIWREQRPWAIIGTGGYGSGPALFAAMALNIPYFIHESNAEPGLVTRLVAKKARGVWLGMEAAKNRIPGGRCIYAGTPVRESFLRSFVPTSSLGPPFTLLVLGGSGGARAINNALFSIGNVLLDKHQDWKILHQTGIQEITQLSSLPRHPRHDIEPFIENMDMAMENASLVLSRAGASTCAELKVVGRPTVLVPLPNSASDHQRCNAMAFVDENRGLMVEQRQEFRDNMLDALSTLMSKSDMRLALSRPEVNVAVAKCLDDFELI